MLRYLGFFRERIREIVRECERVRRLFGELVYLSDVNFFLVKVDVYFFFLERGIVVRKFLGRLKGYIRVMIGRRENDVFLKVMEEWKDVVGF